MSTSQNPHLDALNEFAQLVWGNSQAVLKRHPRGFEFIDLGGYLPAFRSFFARVVVHDKLLVRNEYRVALQALETNSYEAGVYVTGQPGIGKTLFLVYLLVRRLGQQKPVAVQFLNGKGFYALFKDTVSFHLLTDGSPLRENPSVWALCDSNQYVTIPDGLFLSHVGVRVIQTTPPTASRWKEWSKQVGAQPYIMDIWSEEEVVQLATLLGLDAHRTMTLAEKWGNIPRSLVKYIDEDDWAVETSYRNNASRAVNASKIMLDQGRRLDLPDDAPSQFYFLRPMGSPARAISREFSCVIVPTQTIRCILAEALKAEDNLTRLRFYNALTHHPNTHQVAGFIFESWFHSFFVVHKMIDCQWVVQGHDNTIIQFPTTSTTAGMDLIPATKNAPKSATPPYYWIPSKTNFPGIDSALVLKDEIFVFQVIMSSVHTTPINGLQYFQEMLPHDLKNVHWRVVFVGPEEGPIKTVAKNWGGQLFPHKTMDHLVVGWSVVDPVQDDVTYREYHEQSKQESESD
ncbi:hypothetical protein HD554DRAFT_2289333 [Boletus coccyginus]|nr:hypothetical protein HD554DRAFT_2289333 [Boletus coccyginus]